MAFNYLNVAIDGSGIAFITLNRPAVHNAFNEAMVRELIDLLEHVNTLSTVRVVLLKSQGKSFSAGADITWIQQTQNRDEQACRADAALLAQLMQRLYTLSKTTIALVQGAAYGGGVGLVACCDIALASPEAVFCFSEVKIGLIPAVISPYIILAIGARQAQRYFLTAEKIEASKALSLGLVHELVPSSELLDRGYALAQSLLTSSPSALMAIKKLVQDIAHQPFSDALIQKTVEALTAIRVSDSLPSPASGRGVGGEGLSA
jgi:methylglutaconyl-CoA hydratase